MPPLNTTKRTCLALAVTQAIAMPIHAATITVDSISGTPVAGACTLHSAITSANTNTAVEGCIAGGVSGRDIIDLTALPTNSTVTLSRDALPPITSSISINGPGQDELTISGYNNSTMFRVAGPQTGGENNDNANDMGDLIISSMTFADGDAPITAGGLRGGVFIASSAKLEINESTFYDNSSSIYSSGTSEVTINNSTFERNRLDGSAVRSGGTSSVTINNSTMIRNFANAGGPIFALDSSSIIINNSTVSDNSTAIQGNAIRSEDTSEIIINNSRISNNSGFFGSGIRSEDTSEITINNSLISGNSSRYLGGGVHSEGSSTMTINNSTLTNNISSGRFSIAGRGGAACASDNSEMNINNSTLVDNTAGLEGGSVCTEDESVLSISNSIIVGGTITNPAETSNGSTELLLSSSVPPLLQNNVLGSRELTSSEAFGGFTPNTSNIIATRDQLSVASNQIIAPLADYGGLTLTYGLREGSPALNAGDNSNCPATDQRGVPRDDGACDIGSVEGAVAPALVVEDETFFVVPLKNGNTVIFGL